MHPYFGVSTAFAVAGASYGLAGMVASLATQSIAIASGDQHGFSTKDMLEYGFEAGATGGFFGANPMTGTGALGAMSKLLTEVILNTVEQEVEVIARGRTNLDMQTAVLNASIASADSGIAGAASTNANLSPMGSAAMMTAADELLTSVIKHHGPRLEDAVANFVGHAVQNEASAHQQQQLQAKRQAQINTNPNEHIQTTNSFNAKTIEQRINAQNDDTYEQSKRSTGGASTITDNSNPNSQVSSADYQLETTATRQAQQLQQQANTQNRFASSAGQINPAWQSSLTADVKAVLNTQTQDVNPYATSSIANQAPLNALSGTAGLSLPAASLGNNRAGFFTRAENKAAQIVRGIASQSAAFNIWTDEHVGNALSATERALGFENAAARTDGYVKNLTDGMWNHLGEGDRASAVHAAPMNALRDLAMTALGGAVGGAISEGVAFAGGALRRSGIFNSGSRILSASEGSIAGEAMLTGKTETLSPNLTARRAYLNAKFGREKDLHVDITLRGYLEQAAKLNVSSPPNSAVFYSGIGNRAMAEEFSRISGKTTLEMTPGGRYLDNEHIDLILPKELSIKPWLKLSERYAQAASGDTYAFIYGARSTSVFNTVELPVLLENTKVTAIFERETPYLYETRRIANAD